MNKFVSYEGLTFDDVLIVPKLSDISSRSECSTYGHFGDFPWIPANMDTISGPWMVTGIVNKGGTGILHRYMPVKELIEFLETIPNVEAYKYYISVGVNDKDRILAVRDHAHKKYKNVGFCIDVAHGHSKAVIQLIKYIRSGNESVSIIAGNVATARGARDLFQAGANIVKVGIGPGSVCSTRTKTGVGVPQLTAIMECAEEGLVIADGGFKHVGDCVKALAAHRNVVGVMSGSLFAGTSLTPNWQGEGIHIEYRGMASEEAQLKFKGKFANTEGISATVIGKAEGSTFKVISELNEGLKSAMSYVGCNRLGNFADACQFVKVSSHTSMENIPHFGIHKK